jgi:hypothetical protein
MATVYFYTNGKQKFGPASKQELLDKLACGAICVTDMVSYHDDWVMLLIHPDFSKSEVEGAVQVENALSKKNDFLEHQVADKPRVADQHRNVAPEHQSSGFLISDGASEFLKQNQMATPQEITPILESQVQWYVKNENEQISGPFSFLDLVGMLHEGMLYEYSMVSNSKSETWQKIAQCADFKPNRLKEFCVTSEGPALTGHFRRRFYRKPHKEKIIVFDGQALHKALCTDISEQGLGIVLVSRAIAVQDLLFIKLDPAAKKFDLQAKVMHKMDISSPVKQQPFGRYGLGIVGFVDAESKHRFDRLLLGGERDRD